jgi:Tfp pilus assembly protein PilO
MSRMTVSLKHMNRLCLTAVAAVTLLSASIFGISLAAKWRQVRVENELLSQQSNDLDRAENSLQQVVSLLNATRREVSILNERIPATADLGKFIKQLQARINAREIELLKLTPLPADENRRYVKVPIKLELSGSFVNIFQLLNDLETMRRMVRVEKLVIAKGELDTQCHAELTACVFEHSEAMGDKLRKII